MNTRVPSIRTATRAVLFSIASFASTVAAVHAAGAPTHTTSTTGMPRIVPDGAGGTYSTWFGDNGSGIGLLAQHLDAAGNAATGWPLRGAQVAAGWGWDNVALCPDGLGGAFVAYDQGWDYGEVILRHVSAGSPASVVVGGDAPEAAKHPLPGIDAGGNGTQKFDTGNAYPALASDGAGGAYLVWSYNQELQGSFQVRLMRWARNGSTLTAMWPNPAVLSTDYQAFDASCVPDGAGGVYVAWAGGWPSGTIRLAHVLDTGALAPGWPVNGIALSPTTGRAPGLVPDGALGVIVAWADRRASDREQVYAQRVASDASVRWDPAGVALCTQAVRFGPNRFGAYGDNLARRGDIITDGAGGALVTWSDLRNGTDAGLANVYAQRVTAAGTIAAGWAADGNAVCAAFGDQSLPALAADGAGGAYVVWQDARDPAAPTVRWHRIDGTGHMSYGEPADGALLSGTPIANWAPAVAPRADHSATVIWADTSDPATNIRISNVFAGAQSTGPAATTLSVTSDRNPAREGRVITLTAQLSPANATGTVRFSTLGYVLGTAPVAAGRASIGYPLTSFGNRTITAEYSGDAAYAPSGGFVVEQVLPRLAPAIACAATPSPALTARAGVASATLPADATGTVEFRLGGIPNGPQVLGTAAVTGGVATLAFTSPGTPGTWFVTANYPGDTLYTAATASCVLPVYTKLPESFGLMTQANPSTSRDLDLVATLTPAPPSSTVQFFDGATPIGTAPLVGGTATLHWRAPTRGTRMLHGAYPGDADHDTADGFYYQAFTGAPLTMTLDCTPGPFEIGQPIDFVAVLQPTTATGTVTFSSANGTLGTAPVVAGVAHIASVAGSTNAVVVDATYSGDTTYASCMGTVTFDVHGIATSVQLATSANPILSGSRIRFTATVAPPSSSGQVQFTIDGIAGGTVDVSGGRACLTRSDLAEGSHEVSASFLGGPVYKQSYSNSIVQQIQPAMGPVSRVLSPNDGERWTVGQPAMITWDASAQALAPTVSIYLARTTSMLWESIASEVPNTGSYTWLVTGPNTNVGGAEAATATVLVIDENGGVGSDQSDLPFAIVGGSPLGVDPPAGTPLDLALGAARPNPSRGPVALDFSVPRAGRVRLEVLDLQGRVRSVLADGDYAPGRYRAQWDGRDGAGAVPAGVYYVRCASMGRSAVRRVAIVR